MSNVNDVLKNTIGKVFERQNQGPNDSARDADQQSESRSIVSEATFEEMTPKEAIELIKEFDGKNIGVEGFISSIEDVRHQVTRQDYLRRLVIAKRIVGDAARELQEYETDSYEKLYGALRLLFGNLQPVSVYRDKRSRMFQGRVESVSKFTNRFLEVQNQVLAVLANSTADENKRKLIVEYEREQGLEQYLLGLRKEISTEVRAQRPDNIRAAIAKAQAAEAYDYTREMMTRNLNLAERNPGMQQRAPRSSNRPPVASPTIQRTPMTCTYCQKLGHLERDCRKKIYDTQRRSNAPAQPSGFRGDRFPPRPPPRVNHVPTEETNQSEETERSLKLTALGPPSEWSSYPCETYADQDDSY